MSKALIYVADAALIAGAIAMTIVTGGGGMYALGGAIQLTAGQVTALATTMAMMGAGQLLSAIGAALSGGGVSTAMSVKAPSANRQTIYGQMRVNGTCIYTSSIGHTINQVIAWASHPCQSIDFVYLDGREVYFYGNGHNAVAGASGFDDDSAHYDSGNNKYDFGGSNGSNFHVYVQNYLGSYSGGGLPALDVGVAPPHGDNLFTGDPNWNANCTLNGICATYVGAAYNVNMFSGIPQVKAAIKGKCDIYDPRINSTLNADGTPPVAACGWTDNAALIIADVLTNKDYGLGYTWSEIDIPALIAAANLCDTPVTLAAGKLGSWFAHTAFTIGQMVVDANGRQQTVSGYYNNGSSTAQTGSTAPTWNTTQGGVTYDNQIIWTAGVVGSTLTEKMYTINGVVDWGSTPGDTLSQMLEAIGGQQCLTTWNGMVRITPAAWYGSTTSLTQADLFGGVKAKERKSRDLCNAVRAKFICPSYPYAVVGYDKNHKDSGIFDGQYHPVDAPEYAQDALHGYASDVNLAADGVKLYQDRSYHFVTSVGQAQRLMKIYLLRNRKKVSCTIKCNAKALKNVPQDVIQLTFPPMGWTNKYFEISEIRHGLIAAEGQAPQVTWEMDLLETDPSIYTWSTAEERTVLNTASPTLNSANLNVVAPTGLTLSSDLSTALVGLDGIVTPRILATWTQPADTFTTTGGSIVVQYQKVGDTAWKTFGFCPGTTTQVYIDGVVAGQSHLVQIAAEHANGAASAWVGAGPITIGSQISNIAAPTVLNPNFELGDTGWSKQTGWSITQNGHSFGSGTWSAQSAAGSGTSALSTNVQTPCLPGQVYSATCMGLGVGLDTTTTLTVRVNYWKADGTVLSSTMGTALNYSNSSTWAQSKCTSTAPAGTAYVTMDIASWNHTSGTWYVDACSLTFVGDNTSSSLNGQGSIIPTQAVTLTNSYTSNSITVSWPTQSLYRSDTLATGNTLNITAGSQTFSSLSASTKYYFYPYVDVLAGTIGFSGGILAAPSSTFALQSNADGRLSIPYVNMVGGVGYGYIQTAASGGSGSGGSGGSGICPEGEELVEEQTKGIIKAREVQHGDWLKGYSFSSTEDNVYRQVSQVRFEDATIWRMVDGHRVSPCEPIYHEGEWKPAFKATGATIDRNAGMKVQITLNVDNYDEQNYYLVSGTPLLIHNQFIES